jgi:phenylacetate-coenzyme A ligase PaaK-like adenylate-forming protein
MSFIATFKKSLQTLNQQNFTTFTKLALDLFRFQAVNNATYHLYIKYLGINPTKITKLTEIPFMPIEFFKTHKVLTHETDLSVGLKPPDKYYSIFESSKTTGQIASCHHVLDTDFYLQNAEKIFNSFYGDLSNYHLLALLPSYLERQTSSLVYMVQGFMHKTSSFSGFYLDNFEELALQLQKLQATKQKILLIGVTFALLDFAEQFPIHMPNAIIMETGGMKGRRVELLREEVHQILTSAFACDAIHSEYGMTELLSQGYSKGQGIFELPPTMRVFIRNITDPFEVNGNFRDGGINIIDLANVESCAFIETKDIGCFVNDEKTTFKVLGRYDNSEVRGCNLLVF